jgi:acetoacetate decarboxylase
MTFTPLQDARYDMPVAFGPSVASPVEEGMQSYSTMIIHTTDKDAIAPLLPKWFEPADEPTISVHYTHATNLKWMGGRGYNIVSISTNVNCNAGEDPIAGPYTLAMWESDAAPILAGRELMGCPKMMGNIPDVDVFANSFSFRCCEYEAQLVEGSVSDTREMNADELEPFVEAGKNWVNFNWKYIPGLDGEPDADYPTALYGKATYERGVRGHGRVSFGAPTDQAAPYSAKIVRGLAEIPLLEHVDAVSLYSSYGYLFRERTRRLDK